MNETNKNAYFISYDIKETRYSFPYIIDVLSCLMRCFWVVCLVVGVRASFTKLLMPEKRHPRFFFCPWNTYAPILDFLQVLWITHPCWDDEPSQIEMESSA